MEVDQIVREERRSYEVVKKALEEVINELQTHQEPQFDTLHQLVIKSKTLFEGISCVAEEATACRSSYVQTLCGLFGGEYSQEEAIARIKEDHKELQVCWEAFEFAHDESNWINSVYGVSYLAKKKVSRSETYKPLPEIERHSFLD